MFSPLTASIPYLQSTDGNRIQMGISQTRQSEALASDLDGTCAAEVPLIRTQMSDSFESRFFIKRALDSGKVRVIKNKIFVEYTNGGFDVIDIYPQFDVRVIDNQLIQKNDILMIHKGYWNDRIFRFGTHLNVIYGELKNTFEDAILVSESAANKLTSIHVYSDDFILTRKTIDINYDLLENKFVKQGDWLIKEYKKPGDLLAKPVNIIAAEHDFEVVSVEVQVFEPKIQVSRNVQAFIDQHDVEKEFDNYKHLVSETNQNKLKSSIIMHDNEATMIVRITYKYLSKLEPGDKLVNRYGNKGIVSDIISDEDARSRFPHRDIFPNYQPDLFLNPLGIHSRLNPSQLAEHSLMYVLKYTIPQYVKLFISKGYSYDKILKFIVDQVHRKLDTAYADNVEKELARLSENELKIIIYEIIQYGLQIELPVIGDNLLVKSYNIVKALAPKYFKYLDPNQQPFSGFGVEYILKLEHMVHKKINSISTGMYSFKGVSLDGQRVGEMEFHAIMAYGADAALYSFQNPKADAFSSKNIMYEKLTTTGACSVMDLPDEVTTSKRLVSSLLKIIKVDLHDKIES